MVSISIPADLPFSFKQLKFPVRLAFASKINKPQEQLFKWCGVKQETMCFSHGQVYVACSRVDSPKHFFIPGGKTKIVVFRQG